MDLSNAALLDHPDTNRNVLITQTADLTHTNGADQNAFGSLHPGGAQFAFADGSVHFLSETIDAKDGAGSATGTWQRLGARNDHQSVGEYPLDDFPTTPPLQLMSCPLRLGEGLGLCDSHALRYTHRRITKPNSLNAPLDAERSSLHSP